LNILPVNGDNETKDKAEKQKSIEELQTIINYLEQEQKNNPSPANQQKLDEAKKKLKNLEEKGHSEFSYTPSSNFPTSKLVAGGAILLIFLLAITLLSKITKNKHKY
jgi:exonuclease VII small subunit